MQLSCATVPLVDSKKLREYPMIQDGAVVIQSKIPLESVPGLILSYDEDVFKMSDGNEANARMPCGHTVTRDGMTGFLRSLVEQKRYLIRCPGRN
jgi:hypothetical protein